MTAIVQPGRLQTKSHAEADEIRTPTMTRVELVKFPEITIGRFTAEPGWRWSRCIAPMVGTATCQVAHVGHVISGRVLVQMDDGSTMAISAGDSYTIPPGHDAWVDGEERFVCIEIMKADIG